VTSLDVLVGFGRALRGRGLPVGTGRILTFRRAVVALQPITRASLYIAAKATLVSDKKQMVVFDAVFADYFEDGALADETAGDFLDPNRGPASFSGSEEAGPADEVEDLSETEGEAESGAIASPIESLRERSFAQLSDEELARVTELIRRLRIDVPTRRSRRHRPTTKGHDLDLRRTIRDSLRTEGEPFRRAWKSRGNKSRPLVLLLDSSGSMSSYSTALMQFGFAAVAAGRNVEVFAFGTRLTRVTRALRTRNPNEALRKVAELAPDSEGGTRIGDSLRELLRRYSQHGFLRGAVVVLCSDGLERGDPASLATAMTRLSRVVHSLIWVNPLKGSPIYEPLARGMAAALPHVDVFVPGHNMASLEELGRILDRQKGKAIRPR
jgi:uncharacterized protein with von Willebrand factor type A (vWA) domain